MNRAVGYGFEKEELLDRRRCLYDLIPVLARPSSTNNVAHRQMSEDGFDELSRIEDSVACKLSLNTWSDDTRCKGSGREPTST